jgi:hypothetical protein
MPPFSLLSDLDRKVILFTHENHHRHKKPLPSGLMNEEYRAYVVTEGEYILWELEKRRLTKDEVIAHAWMVTSMNDISLVFHFFHNNKIKITSLFCDEECEGLWELEDGIVKVRFFYTGHLHDINIIANNNRCVHSALQIIDNKKAELLKVAPIIDASKGKALND